MAGARGIVVDLIADVTGFLRGTKDATAELEKVSDSLDDVARDGDKAAEKLEQSFSDMARSIKTDAEKAERAVDQIGGAGAGVGKAGDAMGEMGEEAREMAASFDGSMSSVADSMQATAANALAVFGPAGLVAGVLLSTGVGIFRSFAEKSKEEIDALNERTSALFDSMVEGIGVVDAKLREQETKKSFADAFGGGDYPTALIEIQRIADNLGVNAQDLYNFMTTTGEPSKQVADALDKAQRHAFSAKEYVGNVATDVHTILEEREEQLLIEGKLNEAYAIQTGLSSTLKDNLYLAWQNAKNANDYIRTATAEAQIEKAYQQGRI